MPIFPEDLPENCLQDGSLDPGDSGENHICSCCLVLEILLGEVETEGISAQIAAKQLLL